MAGRRRASHDIELSRAILAVILVIAAIVVSLSFFDKAGALGVVLNQYLLSFLFGSLRFLAPLFLLLFAWFLVKDGDYEHETRHIAGGVLFFLALASVLHLSFAPDAMWREALEGNGGGVFGMSAWPLKQYLGPIASWVIMLGLILVSGILVFHTSAASVVAVLRRGFTAAGSGISFLFAAQEKRGGSVAADEEDDEDADDFEEDDEAGGRFRSKSLNEEEDEDADEEAYEDEEEEETPRVRAGAQAHAAQGDAEKENPWAQKVIIKDLPPLSLLHTNKTKPTSGDIKGIAQSIQDTLEEFNITVEMGEVRVGPTVTQYSLKPSRGVKLSRITALHNDLALALAAHPIRIEAPIPGKSLVGIEVPNQRAAMVTFKELLESKEFGARPHHLSIALGKDVGGRAWFADLPKMPHLLIAGATGSGKTVCMNTILMSLLYQNTAETLRLIMVDPKRVELTLYNGIPHLLTPVITNTHKTINALKWTVGEMDRRFEVLSQAGNRDITSYNAAHPGSKLPNIVFVIDELADLMATAASEVEAGIIRLAQMARAVGIHLILATQRPSVDVITGLMKANIPARIAFSVASIVDSRTILDSPGAEKLLGRGDMLFQTAELSKPVRIQGAFISEEEMKSVVEYLKGDEEPEYIDSITEKQSGGTMSMFGGASDSEDPLFEDAKTAILEAGKASASFLQRRLKVGYARAARILDELEAAGIIGPGEGAKPREILVTETEVDASTDMDMHRSAGHSVFDETDELPVEVEDEEIDDDSNDDADGEEEDEDELIDEAIDEVGKNLEEWGEEDEGEQRAR